MRRIARRHTDRSRAPLTCERGRLDSCRGPRRAHGEGARTLHTENIPADGHAIAVALATGELLRASWAELALAFAPPPARAVPATVLRIIDTSLARHKPHARIVGIGVAFATEAFTSGFVRFGADARVSVDLAPRFSASVRAGFRHALPITAPDGTVTADALVFGGEGSVPLFSRDARWNLDLLARLDVAVISFGATPLGGANAGAATLASFEASGGVRATCSLTETLRLSLEGGAGGAIIAANARDGSSIVSGTNGALFFGALALVGKF